jgi:hypothetical protein
LITSKNVHRSLILFPFFSLFALCRLLLAALTCAAKFYDDVYYSNAYYAKVGGVSTQELNQLEAAFLEIVDWRLFVTPEEYLQVRLSILKMFIF